MLCAGDSIAAFGGFIKEAGTFSNTFTGANGCDSVHTINLVFTEMIETVSEQMLCEGDSIAVLGDFVKEEGAFSRTFSSASGCDSMHTVIVNFNEPITANITTSLSCPENANGGLELLIAGGTGPYQVEWNGNDIGNTTNVNNLSAGIYEVTVMDSLGCRRTENVLIEAAQKPSIDADILDVSCFGQADGSITLFSEVAGVAFSLDGTNFETATSFSDLRPSAYEISIKDELGCIFTEIYEIAEPLQTTVSLPEMTTINLGASVILEPSISTANQVSYEWTEIESLSCSDCENPIAAPLKDTKYTVTIYDENNCESQADTWVIVEANQNLYVPNVFSPNGDGQNDIFLIQSAEGPIDEIEFFKIYDRWGNLLYEANNFSPNDEAFGWNGQFRGQSMDNGVYIFVANVKFRDGTATQIQGDITLVK